MAISSLGSIGTFGPGGQLGQVLGRQTVGQSAEGQELVALRIRTLQPLAPNEAQIGARVSGSPSQARLDDGPVPPRPSARTPERLSSEERAVVDRLRQRDGQVRQEEQAHAAAAGDLAGPIDYVYQTGPDGRRYAVGGSVPLRAQAVSGDPAEIVRLGARMAAAAHAATNPSGADLAAAAKGYQLAAADPYDPKGRPGSTLDFEA